MQSNQLGRLRHIVATGLCAIPVAALLGVSADGKIQQPEITEAPRSGEAVAVLCEEPRPMICTQEYKPVCARMDNGTWRTYPSGCSACADASVIGYEDGPCT